MNRRILAAASFLAALFLLTACGAAVGGPSEVLVEYRKTGGIAGIAIELVVQRNGQALLITNGNRESFQVDPATYDQLVGRLESAGFNELKSEYLPEPGGADLFTYEITYEGRTVLTMDTAVPEALEPALALLDEIARLKGDA